MSKDLIVRLDETSLIKSDPHTFINNGTYIHQNNGSITINYVFNESEFIPLRNMRIDPLCYNLFVVSGEIKQMGDFVLDYSQMLKHTSKSFLDKGKLTKDVINLLITYPAIITNKNASHKNAGSQACYIGKITAYEPLEGKIKFRYILCAQLPQQALNDNEEAFAVFHSDQTNEVDEIHWDVKKANIIEFLGLEGELSE
jgi:hypothetical protein